LFGNNIANYYMTFSAWYVIKFYFTDNLLFVARYLVNHWEFQAVGNFTISVDSFFFLSGLLVTYLHLRKLARKNSTMNVPLMYTFRYLRCVITRAGSKPPRTSQSGGPSPFVDPHLR